MFGYYINLDDRTDRKEHIINNIKKYEIFSNLERLSAIKHDVGAIGCSMSHIKIMEEFVNSNEEYLIVLEDDFFIINEDNFKFFLKDFEEIKYKDDWDIIVLTPFGKKMDSSYDMEKYNFQRIYNNQTATGYIIKKSFSKILLDNFKESLVLALNGIHLDICAIDQYWKKLQNQYNFYYYKNIFAGQLPGYSSIEKKYTDYNRLFINQK